MFEIDFHHIIACLAEREGLAQLQMHVHMYTHTYISICVYICTYLEIHIYIYLYICIDIAMPGERLKERATTENFLKEQWTA